MAENKNIFQRLFSTFGFASGSRIPIRSNIYGFGAGRGGYNKIGTSTSRIFGRKLYCIKFYFWMVR